MWILLAMIAIMPFEQNPYLYISESFLGVFPDFTMIKLLGLVGLGWAVFEAMTGRVRLGLLESSQGRAFFLFLVSVVFAGIIGGAGLRPLTRLISIICFFPLVLAVVQAERNLRLALGAAGSIMILTFPYGYRQVLRFGGRYGVGLYETNYLALALVLVLPITFVLSRLTTTGWRRMFWTAGTGILLLEIILTGSRGGFLGLLVISTLISIRFLKQRALAFVVLTCLLIITIVFPTTLGYRLRASGLDSDVQDAGTRASDETRLEVLKAGLRMIQANPLTGVGLGNFKPSTTAYGAQSSVIAHNTYLQIAAELGLPALMAFMWLLSVTYVSLTRSQHLAASVDRPDLANLAIAMRVGLTGWMISAFFLSAEFEKFFWLMVFLSICLERIVVNVAQDAEPNPVPEDTRELPLAWPIR